MRNFKIVLLAAGLFLVAMWSNIRADSFEEEKIIQPHVHKFSRGIVNIGTAPLEIPKQMIKRAQDGKGPDGQVAGYITGIFTGVGWSIWRLGSGIVDIVTFPFPGNKEGMIDPEFVSDENPLTEE